MFDTNIIKKLQTIGLDSFKMRIPLDRVEILNPNLQSYYADLNLDTAEVDELTMKRRALLIAEEGCKTRYLIERKVGAVSCEYLVILANAKLLKSEYLSGITAANVKQFYKAISNHKVIKISLEEILQAKISDCDLKIDVIIKDSVVRDDLFEILKGLTRFTQDKQGGVDFKKQKGNRGIQWSKREVANITYPYIKIYAKDLEMLCNDAGVHNTVRFVKYNNILVEQGLTRLEATIKNLRHWQSLVGNKEFSLAELFKLSKQDAYEIILKMMQKHLDMNNKFVEQKKKKKKKDNMSESDIYLLSALELLVENSRLKNQIRGINRHTMTPLQALDYIARFSDCRTQKFRIKSRINELWFEHIQSASELERDLKWAIANEQEGDRQARTKQLDSLIQLFTGITVSEGETSGRCPR